MKSACDSLCSGEVYLIPSVFGPVNAGANTPPYNNGAQPPAINSNSKDEFTCPFDLLPGTVPFNPGVLPSSKIVTNLTASWTGSSGTIIQAGEFQSRGGFIADNIETAINGQFAATQLNNKYEIVVMRSLKAYNLFMTLQMTRYDSTAGSPAINVVLGEILIDATSWADTGNFNGGRTGDIASYQGPSNPYFVGQQLDQTYFSTDKQSASSQVNMDMAFAYNPLNPLMNPNGIAQQIGNDTSISIPFFAIWQNGANILDSVGGSMSLLAMAYTQGS